MEPRGQDHSRHSVSTVGISGNLGGRNIPGILPAQWGYPGNLGGRTITGILPAQWGSLGGRTIPGILSAQWGSLGAWGISEISGT